MTSLPQWERLLLAGPIFWLSQPCVARPYVVVHGIALLPHLVVIIHSVWGGNRLPACRSGLLTSLQHHQPFGQVRHVSLHGPEAPVQLVDGGRQLSQVLVRSRMAGRDSGKGEAVQLTLELGDLVLESDQLPTGGVTLCWLGCM